MGSMAACGFRSLAVILGVNRLTLRDLKQAANGVQRHSR